MRENLLNLSSSLDGGLLPAANGIFVYSVTQYTQTHIGQIMPELDGNHAQKHQSRWLLLERDDDGRAFAITYEEGNRS